jgi:hypothetical protein
MTKLNCWDFKKCGRQPGGAKVAELGVCPTASMDALDGTNGGKNAGRSCWAVTGSFCGGTVQGTYAAKLQNCMKCDFYKLVHDEEGAHCARATQILARLPGATR